MFGRLFSAAVIFFAALCSDTSANNSCSVLNGNINLSSVSLELCTKKAIDDHVVNINTVVPEISAVADSKVNIPIRVINTGDKSFRTLDIIVEINGEKQNIKLSSDQQVSSEQIFNVEVKTPGVTGEIPFNISIDKVDGVPNNGVYGKTEGKIKVLTRKVDHKVVVEEFTGFWCGWCPKGIVAMEKLKQVYGDKVVIVTVHHNDALECKDYQTLANQTVLNYPQAHVDRTIMSVDPYYGSSLYKVFGIGLDVDTRAAVDPVAEVIAEGQIDGDILTAKADVKFLYTGEAHHALAFVLTENNMHNSNWVQANFLTQWKGQPIEELEPMFDKWINGTSKMEGIIFDDVAMAAKGLEGGIQGSIPTYVYEEESNTYEVEFDLHKIKKVMDYDELNLCVFLFDTVTGHIENADSKSFNPAAGIEGITDSSENEEIARYTIDGRRINSPQKGINIIKYSDGSVKKVIIK